MSPAAVQSRIDAAEARARRPEIRALLNSLRQLDAALASAAGDVL